MKTFKIVRKRWARGGMNGSSQLRNNRGAMCCLGFYAKGLGARNQAILDVTSPEELVNKAKNTNSRKLWASRFKGLVKLSCDHSTMTALGNDLMLQNDDIRISEEKRESKIARLFLKLGVKVKFK